METAFDSKAVPPYQPLQQAYQPVAAGGATQGNQYPVSR